MIKIFLIKILKFLISYYIVHGSIPTLGILIFAYLNTLGGSPGVGAVKPALKLLKTKRHIAQVVPCMAFELEVAAFSQSEIKFLSM